MKTVAVIQARVGSARLPGKILADIGGRTMLARVVRRARRARYLDLVLVATSEQEADDAVGEECARLGVEVHRGSENDVLDRLYRAARSVDATNVVRITADCPLIDPKVIDRVCRAFLTSASDYASNTLERTWPRGLDTEVMTVTALERAWREATESWERAHVTSYIYRNPERFALLSVTGDRDHSTHRWTVDTAEDLELVRRLYGRLGDDDHCDWRQALAAAETEPRLDAINAAVATKALEEG